MNRITLLPLLLLAQPIFGHSLKERIEAEATEVVTAILAGAVQTTLISEGRPAEFAARVGRLFATAYTEATHEQRQIVMRSWLEGAKRRCSRLQASGYSSTSIER